MRASRAWRTALVALLAAAWPAAGAARAQGTATLGATATVDVTALTVVPQQNLSFGAVAAGVATTVDPKTGTTEAYVIIQGARNAQIDVTFALPTVLRAGAGPFTMPISFGATSGCSRTAAQQAQCATFDPAAGLIDRIRNQNPPNNHYHIWLGGTVSPPANQQPGVYTGTITVTAVYTGL